MANVFGQMKDLYELQKEARAMDKKMKALKISGLSDNEKVEVIVNGTQELEDIFIDDSYMNEESKRDLEKAIKQAMKDAQKKLQKELMKDMDLDKLKGMLG